MRIHKPTNYPTQQHSNNRLHPESGGMKKYTNIYPIEVTNNIMIGCEVLLLYGNYYYWKKSDSMVYL